MVLSISKIQKNIMVNFLQEASLWPAVRQSNGSVLTVEHLFSYFVSQRVERIQYRSTKYVAENELLRGKLE